MGNEIRGNPKWSNTRSGFTPVKLLLSPLGVKNQSAPAQPLEELETLKFQREELYEFTTQQLVDLGSISDVPMKPSNVQQIIIPFLRRENWCAGDRHIFGEYPIGDGDRQRFRGYPLGGGRQCVWAARNSAVWAVLEPCLYIASHMLLLSGMDMFVGYQKLFADHD
jgi:hypothetical protein